MHGIVRILMDLPELVGIDREVGLRALAAPQAFRRGRRLGQRVVAFAQERSLRARASRPPERRRSGGDRGDRRRRATQARRVAEALQSLRTSVDFQALAALFKRVKNIAKELTGRAPSTATPSPNRPSRRSSPRSIAAARMSRRREHGPTIGVR